MDSPHIVLSQFLGKEIMRKNSGLVAWLSWPIVVELMSSKHRTIFKSFVFFPLEISDMLSFHLGIEVLIWKAAPVLNVVIHML